MESVHEGIVGNFQASLQLRDSDETSPEEPVLAEGGGPQTRDLRAANPEGFPSEEGQGPHCRRTGGFPGFAAGFEVLARLLHEMSILKCQHPVHAAS